MRGARRWTGWFRHDSQCNRSTHPICAEITTVWNERKILRDVYRCYITHVRWRSMKHPKTSNAGFHGRSSGCGRLLWAPYRCEKVPAFGRTAPLVYPARVTAAMPCRAIEETSAFPFTCQKSWHRTLKRRLRTGVSFRSW